jgi:L-ascorbate metabolism protein UlaG (beta-lactamase superfamily)
MTPRRIVAPTLSQMIGITWAGHATALIEFGGVRLLTDPVTRDRVGPLRRVAAPVAPDLLAGVDAVLLSHLHSDHADLPSLRRVASPLVIAPRGARQWLAGRIRAEVRELAVGEEVRVGDVRVAATRATHDPRRWPGGARADPVGFVASAGADSAYFAGDTDLFPAMAELAGSIGAALLPVSGWGPNLGAGHLDAARAAEAAGLIAPRVAIPIHWGTLAPRWPLQGHPDPDRPPREFAELVARHAPEVEVRVLEPGEHTVVS